MARLRASLPGRKDRAKRLFSGNVRAVAFYGSEVHGLSDKELLAAWRLAAKCASPSALGRSLDALALLTGDMLGSLPVAQARRWHMEVWRAACALDPLALSLSDLVAYFEQVDFVQVVPGARAYRGSCGGAAQDRMAVRRPLHHDLRLG